MFVVEDSLWMPSCAAWDKTGLIISDLVKKKKKDHNVALDQAGLHFVPRSGITEAIVYKA